MAQNTEVLVKTVLRYRTRQIANSYSKSDYSETLEKFRMTLLRYICDTLKDLRNVLILIALQVNLLFWQAVHSVVKRDEFPVSERIALQLGGLQAQVQLGEYVEGRGMDKYENVDSYLCSRVRKGGQTARTNMDWAVKIAEAHRMYGSSKSDLIAKVWYLSVVMQVCRLCV